MHCYQDIDEMPNRMLQNDRVFRSRRFPLTQHGDV